MTHPLCKIIRHLQFHDNLANWICRGRSYDTSESPRTATKWTCVEIVLSITLLVFVVFSQNVFKQSKHSATHLQWLVSEVSFV